MKRLGWADPIGKTFGFEEQVGQVIGVVKDFHHRPMQSGIGPVVFCMRQTLYGFIGVKIRAKDVPETLDFLKATWERFLPNRPFEYTFENERDFYSRETRVGNLVGCCSGLAIFVACLGLIGLASFTAERRTKEIGIRKVLGASASGIVMMLSKNFIKLVLIANLIAWPVAYYAANRWLQEFAYRIDISLWPFALGTLLALAIALGTVSYQAFKAARSNPIEALRYE